MKKILIFMFLMFASFVNVKAESFIDLEVRTTFSSNLVKDSIDEYIITIKNEGAKFKIKLSKENNFTEAYEAILKNVPKIDKIEIKSGTITYGYTYKTTSDDEKTVLDVHIYDYEKEIFNNGKLASDVDIVYDPITTSKTTNKIIITKPTSTTEKDFEKEEEEKQENKTENIDIFFKIFIIALIILIIIFMIITLIKVRNANK